MKLVEVTPRILEWLVESDQMTRAAMEYFGAVGPARESEPASQAVEALAARMTATWERGAFNPIHALGAIGTPAAFGHLRTAAAREINSRKSGPWESWHDALWALAEHGSPVELPFIRTQFARKWKTASMPLILSSYRHPDVAALADVLKAMSYVSNPLVEGRRGIAWGFCYLEKVGALNETAVEAIAQDVCLPESFRRQFPPMQRYLRTHFPHFAPG